jgi:hypothetical protein
VDLAVVVVFLGNNRNEMFGVQANLKIGYPCNSEKYLSEAADEFKIHHYCTAMELLTNSKSI